MNKKSTPILSKKCLVCGSLFFKHPYKSLRDWETRAKYCSRRCVNLGKTPWNKDIKYDDSMKSRLDISGLEKGRGLFKGRKMPDWSGDKHPRWIPRVVKKCETCQKEMTLAPWQVKSNQRFCSRPCRDKWHRGPNSPVFMGDKAVSKLRSRIAQIPEYREWHATILKRDNYLCLMCNNRGTKDNPLEVDHIKRFYFIIKENNITTVEEARRCKELWDTSNGQTLCRKDHRTLDTYGTTGLKSFKST